MTTRMRCSILALAGLVASALLSGCGGSSSTTIPATATVFYAHTAVLRNYSALTTGYNAFGQLGNGNKDTKSTLVPVVGLGKVGGIATGADHTVAFANQTTIYAWGSNYHGQIGSARDMSGINAYSSAPVKVPGPKDATVSNAANGSWGTVWAVAAGGFHSLAVAGPNRTVYAWGYNAYGQLGNGHLPQGGDFSDRNFADSNGVQVSANGPLVGVSQIAAGGAHSLALKNGNVYSWGDNTSGQLGQDPTVLGNYANTASEVQRLTIPGDPLSARVPLTNITQIAAGGSTSYALETDTDGSQTLWGWGYNGVGQLGQDPTQLPYSVTPYSSTPIQIQLPPIPATGRVLKISAGSDHLLILVDDGTGVASVWGIGFDRFAQLGNNATTNSSSFVQVLQTAPPAPATPTFLTGASATSDIIAFGNHSLALFDGVWYGWGDNGYGQLGNEISTSSIGYLLLPKVVRGF